MSQRKIRFDDLEGTLEVKLGRVESSEQAKQHDTIRPLFLRLTLVEPDAEPGDFLVDLWDQVDIDLKMGEEEFNSVVSAKCDALASNAVRQASALRSIRASERSVERRIEKLLGQKA